MNKCIFKNSFTHTHHLSCLNIYVFIVTPFQSSYWAGSCSPEVSLSAEVQEQVTPMWYQSPSVLSRNCFKQTQKGSATKTHKYVILKFFFIIYLERWKKLKKKKTKKTTQTNTEQENHNIFYFPEGCFPQREALHQILSTFVVWFRKEL